MVASGGHHNDADSGGNFDGRRASAHDLIADPQLTVIVAAERIHVTVRHEHN